MAHLDTVFEKDKKYKSEIHLYYDPNHEVAFCPAAPGFDDTTGIYAIIDIVDQGYRPTIILTQDEELFGIGVNNMLQKLPIAPTDLKYIVELDRQGYNDAVFYNCNNKEFEEYVCSFGFNTDIGSFSDIYFIGPVWKIACVNVSIGYLNEHTYGEILQVAWMEETIEKVCQMINESYEAPSFKFVPVKEEVSNGLQRN